MYRNKFEAIVTLLKSADIITIDSDTITAGMDDRDLDFIESDYGIKLSPPLREFYREVGSTDIRWHVDLTQHTAVELFDIDDTYISGAIQIQNPDTLIADAKGGFWKNILWFENSDSDSNQQLKQFKPFDFQNTENVVGVLAVNNQLQDELCLYFSSDGIHEQRISLQNYMELLQDSLGFTYWPYAYVSKYSEERKKLNHYIGAIFKNHSLLRFD